MTNRYANPMLLSALLTLAAATAPHAAHAQIAYAAPDADVEDDALLGQQLVDLLVAVDENAGPAAPATLTATVRGTALVDLSWHAVEGAAQYQVEWSPDGMKWGILTSTPATECADRDVSEGATIWYRVVALDYAGAASAPSNAARIVVPSVVAGR